MVQGASNSGEPRLRSVDSERVGRGIEPRNWYRCGSRRRQAGGRQNRGAVKGLAPESRRGRRAGHARKGSPRNLGGPAVLTLERITGSELEVEPPSEGDRSETGTVGSRSLSVVPRKPGNRPRDPVEGRDRPGHGIAGGEHVRDSEPGKRVNKTSANSVAANPWPEEPDAVVPHVRICGGGDLCAPGSRSCGTAGKPGGKQRPNVDLQCVRHLYPTSGLASLAAEA